MSNASESAATDDIFERALLDYLQRVGRYRPFPALPQAFENVLPGIISMLQELLPQEYWALIESGHVRVREVEDFLPIAAVIKDLPRNLHLVVVHKGLYSFCYSIPRILSSQLFASGNFSAVIEQVNETTNEIADFFVSYQMLNMPHGGDRPLPPSHTAWAGLVAVHLEAFLLCHEFGHIRDRINGLEGKTIEAGRQREFLADEFAVDLILTRFERQGGDNEMKALLHLQIVFVGITIFFELMQILETLGMRFGSTHPSHRDRIVRIRARLRDRLGETAFLALRSKAAAIENTFSEVTERLLTQNASEQFPSLLDRYLDGFIDRIQI